MSFKFCSYPPVNVGGGVLPVGIYDFWVNREVIALYLA
jgi:hypothetical protein